MAYHKNTNDRPAAQASLELFPDPFDKLEDLKNRMTQWDERYRSLLAQGAQTEIELYRSLIPPTQRTLRSV